MNKTVKKILISLLLATVVVTSIFAQSTKFSVIEGDKNSFSLYNEFGKKVNIISLDNILVNGKIILKTDNKSLKLSYEQGLLDLGANSILIVDPFAKKPQLYLIDGTVTLTTTSPTFVDYVISTPVSKYEFSSPARVNIISTDQVEYGVFFEGKGSSYNSLTGETTLLNSSQLIDMAFPNNFSLDIPEKYVSEINIDDSKAIEEISTTYKAKDVELTEKSRLESEKNRSSFLNSTYLMNIKPIQKSNNFDKYTTINFIITGNGQGNISALDFPAFSGLIKEAKNNNENILLIDGGNTLNGSPYVSFDKGKTAIKVLDLIGYDIFVPGPIDLSYGVEQLTKLDKSSNINFISTNAMNKKQLFYFNPFGLYLFDDFKVAVLGLSNPSDITQILDLDLTNQILIENAQEAINKAHDVADYVILISNLNYEEFDASYILNNIEGIDLAIDSNNSDATLMSINGVPLINTGVGYSEIQNYSIKVKKDEVISSRYAKVYSSNLLESDNRLLTSLNIDSFDMDSQLLSYINTVNIPDNLSFFTIEPSFSNVSVTTNDLTIKSNTILQSEKPSAPTFAKQAILTKPTIISNKVEKAGEKIDPPKFKPISFKVRKESVIEETITNKELATGDTESPVAPRKANIYSGEDLKIKTHIGLDTTLTATADINDASFTNNDYYGDITLVPYIYHGGYSFALRLTGSLDDSLAFSSNLYPLPTTTSEVSEYALNIIDHFSIITPSENINIEANRDTFDPNISSAIAYDTLGGTDLHLTSVFDSNKFQLNSFVSNLDLLKPLNGTTEESLGIVAVFKPVDLLNISIGALGIGNNTILDVYPTFNFNLIPVNNKDIQVKLNVGATLYVPILPTLSFRTIINPSDPNLVPNYLANAELNIDSETLKISVGANYLITEDSTKFTTNMIHKDTIRSAIFTPVSTKTLTGIAKIGYENDLVDFETTYTIPFDTTTLNLGKDLIDINLGLNFGKLSLGGFYLHNDFINHLKSISNIKAFLINSNTEYGGYMSYNLNNLTFKGSMYLPSSSTTPLAVKLGINYVLDKAF